MLNLNPNLSGHFLVQTLDSICTNGMIHNRATRCSYSSSLWNGPSNRCFSYTLGFFRSISYSSVKCARMATFGQMIIQWLLLDSWHNLAAAFTVNGSSLSWGDNELSMAQIERYEWGQCLDSSSLTKQWLFQWPHYLTWWGCHLAAKFMWFDTIGTLSLGPFKRKCVRW